VQNSTAVFQLNISNKTSFCAPKPARTQSPKPLVASVDKHPKKNQNKTI